MSCLPDWNREASLRDDHTSRLDTVSRATQLQQAQLQNNQSLYITWCNSILLKLFRRHSAIQYPFFLELVKPWRIHGFARGGKEVFARLHTSRHFLSAVAALSLVTEGVAKLSIPRLREGTRLCPWAFFSRGESIPLLGPPAAVHSSRYVFARSLDLSLSSIAIACGRLGILERLVGQPCYSIEQPSGGRISRKSRPRSEPVPNHTQVFLVRP